MRSTTKIAPTFLLVIALLAVTGSPAVAAPAAGTAKPPQQISLQCNQDGCTAQAALPGVPGLIKTGAALLLSLVQDQVTNPLGKASVTIDDDLVITLPAGEVRLPNARLTVDLGEDNRIERLHGTAKVPFPSFDTLEDVEFITPAVAEVGLDSGRNLSHLNAPLDEDRPYLFFTFQTGFDVSARADNAANPFKLSVPAGQNATLVVDTQEPMVYLAGNFTMTHDGQIALVGKLLEPIQSLDALPQALPLRQRTQLAASGQLGRQPQGQAVRVGVAHSVDAGVIGEWLGVDVRPLAVEGLLTVTREGMLLNGVASSSIAPDLILDAEARLDAFIPFSGDLEDAYVLVQAQAAVPVAKITADATARVTWPLDVETTAHVVRPSSKDDDTASRTGEDASGAMPAVKQVLAFAGDWAAQSLHTAGDAAARGGQWLARNVAAGTAAVAGLLPSETDVK